MKLKAMIAVTTTAFGLGAATATLFDFSAAIDDGASAFSLAPLSLGHPAAAATLQTHRSNVPGPNAPDAPFVESSEISEISRKVAIRSGSTLSGILVDAGVPRLEAAAAVEAFSAAHDPRRVLAGNDVVIRFRPDVERGTDRFLDQIRAGTLEARELTARYCAMLHARHGTYEEVARITGLDRRTVKKYVQQVADEDG